MKQYLVVGRSNSSAIFDGEAHIRIRVDIEGRLVNLLIATHTVTNKNVKEDRGLYFECYGEADSISDAVEAFANRANTLVGIIAVAANAYVSHCPYELAFEITDGETEREFFQSLVPSEAFMFPITRKIPEIASKDLIRAILTNRDVERILIAVSHYREMLSNWCLEERLKCVTQLFVAVEALGEVAIRRESERLGKTKQELAVGMGIDTRDSKWYGRFLGEIRRSYIFQNDVPTYQTVKDISDGFEHAYKSFDAMREPAHSVVVRAAGYVRSAILELSGVSKESRYAMQADPFMRPKGPNRIVHYVFGYLVGEGPELAAAEQAYPIMQWNYRREKSASEEESYSKVRLYIKPQLAKGINLRLTRYEAWDGSSIIDAREAPSIADQMQPAEVKVTAINEPGITGMFASDAPGTAHFISKVGWLTTNTGSLRFVIWTLIDAFAEAGCRECRHGSISAMTRDVRRRILGSSSEGPAEELLTLLKQADRVDAAHRIAREGAMVLGWDGEAVGVPKQIIMARAVRRKVRSITKLTEAELSEYSVLAADTAKGLQSWLDTYGRELRTHFKG